jgi:ATP-binding cassette, subfamily B, bacterial
VLEDMSFQIQPGQIVGIVGRSGSGKSTIAGLISRLYEVNSGTVRLDGHDIRNISPTELRRHVGIVLQEPFLFEGTVAANIAYGDPHAEPERIIDSAKAAAAHDFILRLPFGYDTPLGERGAGLSGGERQRVSIARAVLYNPRVLILDEATASIDSESEHLIQRAMERFAQGRTTLAIAHRLSTLERADHILVIDRGRLVEQGTHSELLAIEGLYAKFVRLQFGQQALERDANEHRNGHDPRTSERTFAEPDFTTLWLRPDTAQIENTAGGKLNVQISGRQFSDVWVVRAFPATRGEQYLSLRYRNSEGRDMEIGLIQTLSEWPAPVQELIRRALNRRYLLRIVYRFQSMRENHSLLECVAETDDGVVIFAVPNSPQSIKSVGDGGCLLTDVTNNHFLIPSMQELTTAQQQLLLSPVPTL